MTSNPSALPTKPRVRFAINPIPGNTDLTVPCSAPVIESRYAIETMLDVGGTLWPIEVTLRASICCVHATRHGAPGSFGWI